METSYHARKLRKDISPVEQKLWYRVRNRRLGGFKIRRQQAIGLYVVDFYCDEKKVVIEIDGASHGEFEQMQKDPIREKYLHERGFMVIRYRNDQIIHDLETV